MRPINRRAASSLIMLIVVTILCTGISSAAVTDSGHSPSAPEPGDDISIFISLDNASDATSVQMHACLDDFSICFIPVLMQESASGGFEAKMPKPNGGFDDGDIVIYRFEIQYSNSSKQSYPDANTSGAVERDGSYYFRLYVEKEGAGYNLALLSLAFGAGLVTFFSPCNFPLLPSYISYYISRKETGEEKASKMALRGAYSGMMTSAGFLVIFGTVGLAVAYIGGSVLGVWFMPISIAIGIILVILGILLLANINLSITLPMKAPKKGPLSFFAFGMIYALASLSCVLPVFVLVIVSALNAGSFFMAMAVFLVYTFAMSLTMIVISIAVAVSKDVLITDLKKAMPYIKKVSAIILIIAGIYLAWHNLRLI